MAIIRSISPNKTVDTVQGWTSSLLMQDMMIRDKERSKKAIDNYNKSIKKSKRKSK